LKKDVRTVAAEQVHRFEQAMVGQRRWPVPEFQRLIAHPLLVHLVRRLVWLVSDGTAVRVAEDRTLAGVGDDAVEPPGPATVCVAHPLLLGPALPAWADLFADYGILQPFPQLARDVYELLPSERGGHLARFAGRTADSVRLLGLDRRGWRREMSGDSGWQDRLERQLPGGATATVELEPGMLAGAVEAEPQQTVTAVTVRWAGAGPDPVTASEIIRDLEAVTGI
jgi:hypothetical protein